MSSKSSSGSEESEALGVDFSDEGLLTDLVLRSRRPDVPDDEDDCWDWELVARALEDRRGDGGAIEPRDGSGGERGGQGRAPLAECCGRRRACRKEIGSVRSSAMKVILRGIGGLSNRPS